MTQEPRTIPGNVEELMGRFRQGDREAAGHLIDLFYPQLKQLACARMRSEAPHHTWQPTALVNELYLELLKIRSLREPQVLGQDEKAAFLCLAAHVMRRLLIHHARPLAKRMAREEFDERRFTDGEGEASLHEIDSALVRLAAISPELRTVVELRVFEGLTGEEIAARMGCSPRSVARYWNFARGWLAEEFG